MNPRLSLEAQGVAVILFHNTETLPLRMPAPAGTYSDSCRTQGSDEKANLQQQGTNFDNTGNRNLLFQPGV
jgi:hypothetical protein